MKRTQSQSQSQRTSTPKRQRTSTNVLSASTVRASAQKRAEIKRKPDFVIGTPILGSVWTVFPLPLISAGNGSFERDGRAIKVIGFEHRILVQAHNNGATRFVYVLWKNALLAPTAASVFDILSGIPPISVNV